MLPFNKKILITFLLLTVPVSLSQLYAWSMHALINNPVLLNMPEVVKSKSVPVRSLATFLIKYEKELETILANEEKWARKNLEWYKPLPDALTFKKSSNQGDIQKRFFSAIRVNPKVTSLRKTYLQLMPSASTKGRAIIKPTSLTFLKEPVDSKHIRFVALRNGARVSAVEIVNTASDEPDLGMDIGLFTNNKTEFGKVYGFGKQPFGNPNLPYGSQAPFHMGLYHEAGIINVLASFLTQTYPEYRIHLYKTLSEFAFNKGEDYWGWRFMGWGLHYLGDLSQPYHSTALPGYGTTRMLCINILDVVGASGSKDDTVQLVSNRHLAIEAFQNKMMTNEYFSGITAESLFTKIKNPPNFPEYFDDYPRELVALKSNKKADDLNDALDDNMPEKFVSDPDFELSGSNEVKRIIEEVEKVHGKAAVLKLKKMIATLLLPNGAVTKAYVQSILKHKSKN